MARLGTVRFPLPYQKHRRNVVTRWHTGPLHIAKVIKPKYVKVKCIWFLIVWMFSHHCEILLPDSCRAVYTNPPPLPALLCHESLINFNWLAKGVRAFPGRPINDPPTLCTVHIIITIRHCKVSKMNVSSEWITFYHFDASLFENG